MNTEQGKQPETLSQQLCGLAERQFASDPDAVRTVMEDWAGSVAEVTLADVQQPQIGLTPEGKPALIEPGQVTTYRLNRSITAAHTRYTLGARSGDSPVMRWSDDPGAKIEASFRNRPAGVTPEALDELANLLTRALPFNSKKYRIVDTPEGGTAIEAIPHGVSSEGRRAGIASRLAALVSRLFPKR